MEEEGFDQLRFLCVPSVVVLFCKLLISIVGISLATANYHYYVLYLLFILFGPFFDDDLLLLRLLLY